MSYTGRKSQQSFVFFAGVAMVAVGLWWLGGIKPAFVAAVGGAIAYGGPKLLDLALPRLMISGVNFSLVPSYAIRLLGAATMIGGFVIAYRIAQRRYATAPSTSLLTEPVPVTGS